MDNQNPSFLDLLLEAHAGLDRQGPGSPEAVRQALSFLGAPAQFERIADLGCGTGGQTMCLAEHLPGDIVGLDLFPVMIDAFNQRAKAKNLDGRVIGVVGDMRSLPFEKQSFDLIWSEGAIDNIGFREGLRHWREYVKRGGYIAVTCPSWLTKNHPHAAAQFWADAGSQLEEIGTNIAAMQDCGFAFRAAFALPETCWTDHYFDPREKAIRQLVEKYNACDAVQTYAELNRREVDLYLQYKQHYGYVFYIGQAI